MQHQALTYAALGYRVFPCGPGGKRPITDNGLHAATTDADVIEHWLQHHPTANWAICTDGLLIVDTDPGSEGWPHDEQQARELAATPVIAITPRGGRHYYFRQPEGADYRNTQNGQLGEHVDTRANGGYVIVAPSAINGQSYRWLNGEPEIGPAGLPLPPQWLLDKLAAAQRKENQPAQVSGDGKIPDGQRNGSLTKLAGAMRRQGATEPGILAALLQENASRCNPPLEPKEVETIAGSVARYAPGDVGQYLAQLDADAEIEDLRTPDDPGPLPAELLTVPGFVADVMAYNLAGAHKPQPVLALAGGLSLLATLTGRKVTDTQGTRTNLYCIGVAGTSTGKQRAREVNKDVLAMAGLDRMIGPESIGSAQGLVTAVELEPSILFQLDEIGRYLKTMGDAREPYLYNIVSVLMCLFTDSASIFRSDAVIDPKRVKTIYSPNACVYGTTTGEAFYNALTIDSLQDGFLSRVLIFEGDDSVKKRWITKPELPATLQQQAEFWKAFSKHGGNLASVNPQPLVIQSTAAARQLMYAFDAKAQEEQVALGEPLGSLWPRAVEKANKLALLYACSENAQAPEISEAGARWAVDLVSHLTRRLVFLASRWVSENRQEKGVKRVGRIIEAQGPAGIPKAALTLATRWLGTRDRNEHLDTLIESGEVKLRTIPTAGRTRTVYVHRKHLAAAVAV